MFNKIFLNHIQIMILIQIMLRQQNNYQMEKIYNLQGLNKIEDEVNGNHVVKMYLLLILE